MGRLIFYKALELNIALLISNSKKLWGKPHNCKYVGNKEKAEGCRGGGDSDHHWRPQWR